MSDHEAAWKREAAVLHSGILSLGHGSEIAGIVQFAAARYAAPIAALSVLLGGKQILFSTVGINVQETLRSESFCSVTIQEPERVTVVLNALTDDRFNNLPPVQNEPHIRFYAGVPIVDHQGHALGALCIADTTPRDDFDPDALMYRSREIAKLIREW